MANFTTKKIFDFGLLYKIFRYAKPYKTLLYISFFLAVLMAVIAPIRPMLIQITVNKATGNAVHEPNWFQFLLSGINTDSLTQFIIVVTIFQLIFLIIESAIRFLFSFISAWMGQHVVRDLRTAVYKKIIGLSLSQFDKTPIGTLTTRTVNDIESINDIFSDGLIAILADLLTIFVVLTTMFWLNWKFAFVCLIPFPIMIIATYYFKESVNKSFIRVRNAVAALNSFVQEHLTGMQIVQAYCAENKELNKFKRINVAHRDANVNAIFAYSIFFPVVEIVLAVSISCLIWWTAHKRLDPGLLVAFILFLNQIFRPLRVIADKFNVLQMGMIAAERVFKIMDNTDSTVNDELLPTTPLPQHRIHFKGKIDFENVSFAYNADRYVLKNINFSLQPGDTIALVGHTGSGKTSIISLLNRLYPIQKGSIKIDNKDIKDYPLQMLRSNIGVVLQDVFLFSGSIMDNITLRNANISKEQAIAAAKMIGVHDFIMRLPNGYDYNVMERGNTLSLGQRQLISFIRALLYDPSILILDEATSSIDTESELLIQKAIDTLIVGRTSIIIAHRLSTIRKSNAIIVLDKGEVKEIGNHEELLAINGFYAKLYDAQLHK